MRLIYTLLVICLCYLPGCSSDSPEKENEVPVPLSVSLSVNNDTTNLPVPDNRFSNNYQVLLFGNSHIIGLKKLLETLIQAQFISVKANVFTGGGGFLDNQDTQQTRIDLLESRQWTHIILQGQKYSQSGSIDYSTKSAQSWIQKSKKLNITPILFPEHPQRWKTKEAERVHQIHKGIAEKQASCVAPVGLAWDKVIMTAPDIALHSGDGNHAALRGRLLTAYVFYEVITGESADLLPYIEEIDVEEPTQQLLKQLASETIKSNTACNYML